MRNLILSTIHKRHYSTLINTKLEIKALYGKLVRQVVRPRISKSIDTVNLHLGCGSVNHPNFINIDGFPASHIHYVREIDDLSPFQDNSIDLIYACHCLEHFSFLKVPNVIAEWFRVIKKNGILRLSVPDFDQLITIYSENDKDIDTIVGMLMGGQDYKYNFHQTAFTKKKLESLLLNAGFNEIRDWQPGSCRLTTFNDYSSYKFSINDKGYPVSLNIEAVK